jgi:ABC-2 type transport system permease protein
MFEHPALAIFILILVALFFSLLGLINALYAKSFDEVNIIPTFFLTPLTYLG